MLRTSIMSTERRYGRAHPPGAGRAVFRSSSYRTGPTRPGRARGACRERVGVAVHGTRLQAAPRSPVSGDTGSLRRRRAPTRLSAGIYLRLDEASDQAEGALPIRTAYGPAAEPAPRANAPSWPG